MSARAIALIGALSLIACEGGGGARDGGPLPDGLASHPSVELGGGRLAFEPLAGDPAEMELVSGTQGGWHLDVTLRLRGIPAERLEIVYRVARARDGLVLCNTRLVATAAGLIDHGTHLERVADRAILDIAAPRDVVAEALVLSAEVRTGSGAILRDERAIVPVDRIDELPGS